MPWPPENNLWRPFYVVSKARIDNFTIVAALFTHPATLTADCEVPKYSKFMKTASVVPMLQVTAHPSSEESRTSSYPNSEGKGRGRNVMRALDLSVPRSQIAYHTDKWSSSLVLLSHSSLLFVVSRHGKTWTCLPSSLTLQQISRMYSPN